MALVFTDIWGGGKRSQLGVGYHYKHNFESLVVPAGQVVTIYTNEDRTGGKTLPLYEGTYQNLGFYGVSRTGLVVVERTKLTLLDMIEIGWDAKWGPGPKDTHPVNYRLPVGDKRQGRDFPDDKIQWVRIPYGITVEAFVDDNFQGGSLWMSGNDQDKPQLWHLSQFESKTTKYKRFSWNVSSMKVRSDKWVLAGVEFRNVKISGKDSQKFAGTSELSNNSPHEASCSKEVSWEKSWSQEENWNIGGRVCAKAGFEAEALNVKVTGEVEVEVSGGYGESSSNGDSKTITDTVSATVEGFGRAKISTSVEYGKMTADAIRKWRNVRTNAIIEEHGKITRDWANEAKHEVNGIGVEPSESVEVEG